MTRPTILGLLFLGIGLAIIGTVLAPPVAAVIGHQTAPTISFALLITGIALAIFGAWLLPNSGIGPTVTQVAVTLGQTNLPFIGGAERRAQPPTTPTATVTVETKKDGAP